MKHYQNKDTAFWLLVIFAAIYILGNIGTGSLATWDESVYANIARDTLRTGKWFVLHQGSSPWFDKPPLCIWTTAIFYKIFGVNEFATRLTSACFGVATVLLVYLFVKRMYNKNTALLSALLLLALPHYLRYTKLNSMDSALTFFITLMIFLFWMGQERPVYLILCGISFVFAYLTKGLAAFLGPAIIFLYCFLSGNIRALVKKEFIIGIMFAVLAIGLWHLIQYLLLGQEGLRGVIYHFKRTVAVVDGHTGGPNFYQKAIFNKNKPWSVLIYVSLAYLIWLVFTKKDKKAVLLSCWIAGTYIIYALIKTKLHWYIMPIYPALAVASALLIERFFKNKAFALFVALLIAGMIIQVPVSWAFKMDMNADLKKAAQYSRILRANGALIYYRIYDDSEQFYLGPVAESLPDNDIHKLKTDFSVDTYCILKAEDAGKASGGNNFKLEPVEQYGKVVIAKFINR